MDSSAFTAHHDSHPGWLSGVSLLETELWAAGGCDNDGVNAPADMLVTWSKTQLETALNIPPSMDFSPSDTVFFLPIFKLCLFML